MTDIYEILKKYYGYTSFKEGQEEIINSLISGRDTVAIMPTGSGKSLCYQIPALVFEGITIVISPLISLMQDQVQNLISMGVKAAYLNSSLTPRQMDIAMERAERGMYKIIYAAPERLETESFIRFACSKNISLIAVDEAHCISQWGHDFRPHYMKIADFVEKLPVCPVMAAFTATATDRVKNDICLNLRLKNPLIKKMGFDRPNLYFGIYRPFDRTEFVVNYIEKHIEQSGIIYCSTRKNVDSLSEELTERGYHVLPYHAGMSDEQRTYNQNEFIYDRTKIIVATSAFGMGIDKPNVRYVIHYNMPANMEDYYQQAGRAGRDGEPSECILLYSSQDVVVNKFIITKNDENEYSDSEEREKHLNVQLEKLKLMTFYSTSKYGCLREKILEYFGESYRHKCNNCSLCLGDTAEMYKGVTLRADVKKLIIDEALLARLENLREKLAHRMGVPTYSILNDGTVKELASVKPRNISELGKINGFGEAKIQHYGSDFLEVINDYEADSDF